MLLKRDTAATFTNRVIQFGEGNFLRGFADWMINELNKKCGENIGVTIVQPIENGLKNLMENQDFLYTLILRGLKNGESVCETEIIDCITGYIDPYAEWEAFLALAEDKNYEIIISNTTEAGICHRKESPECAPNITFPAKVTLLLKRRFDLNLPGFSFLPCELIDDNGKELKKCILKYAGDWNFGGKFTEWIENENVFASTLVDRIVTGYPRDEAAEIEENIGYEDKIIDTAEIFHLWVIECEKKFIDFEKAGLNVIWTNDVAPYKKRKVRILNGAHTMAVAAAMLEGIETVKQAMDNKDMYGYIKNGIFKEIIPTLDLPENELVQFADDVLQRFSNPFIKHYWSSIALNSVSKFRVRVLPSILEYKIKFGKYPRRLVFSLAALISFYKNGTPEDDKEIKEFMKNANVSEILKNKQLWGADLSELKACTEEFCTRIEKDGAGSIIAELGR